MSVGTNEEAVGRPAARVLVVCVGNTLVADDGVGHLVGERLREIGPPADARIVQLELGGMRLLDELGGERVLVLVDAVQFGAPVGTVHVLDWEEVPVGDRSPVSVHGIGLREVIGVCRALYPELVPEKTVLVGIEGQCFDQCRGPTDEVVAAIDDAVRAVLAVIEAPSK